MIVKIKKEILVDYSSDVSDYSIQVVDKVKELILRFFNERKITYPTHLKEFVTRRLQTWINNAYLAK